ncbi:frizzled-8-like [Convolutriloba macropyga]|uniref:frizzled-8-like n=1 Tax=Convolutriloba macropyga TaxID=536237 RepID=UPI003F51E232
MLRHCLVLTILEVILVANCSDCPEEEQNKCEEITIPMCQEIGYSHTKFPNDMGHDTQEEAGLEIHQFWPLVEVNCSAHLRQFLCAMYAPPCMSGFFGTLEPCREVCDAARDGCEPVIKQYGFEWPERFQCGEYSSCHEA